MASFLPCWKINMVSWTCTRSHICNYSEYILRQEWVLWAPKITQQFVDHFLSILLKDSVEVSSRTSLSIVKVWFLCLLSCHFGTTFLFMPVSVGMNSHWAHLPIMSNKCRFFSFTTGYVVVFYYQLIACHTREPGICWINHNG